MSIEHLHPYFDSTDDDIRHAARCPKCGGPYDERDHECPCGWTEPDSRCAIDLGPGQFDDGDTLYYEHHCGQRLRNDQDFCPRCEAS